jgi:hypothetical protein
MEFSFSCAGSRNTVVQLTVAIQKELSRLLAYLCRICQDCFSVKSILAGERADARRGTLIRQRFPSAAVYSFHIQNLKSATHLGLVNIKSNVHLADLISKYFSNSHGINM